MHNFEFRCSYVCFDGKIFNGGIIEIIRTRIKDKAGYPMFCQKLARYADGRFHVVLDNLSHVVKVVKTKERRLVNIIPFEEFHNCNVWICLVMENGWLKTVGSLSQGVYKDGPYTHHCVENALRLFDEGKRPSYFDNSTFTKVSAKYSGQKVLRVDTLKLDFSEGPVMVFTRKRGRLINSHSSKPISYARWKTGKLE